MCGVAGLLQHQGLHIDEGTSTVRAMAYAIRHRGPDDSGVWVQSEDGIALGHQRLSIVDLSAAGHQPMRSASGRWVIAFNGEIYNHESLRRSLEADSAVQQWRGHSDTETLLEAFDAWGIEKTLRRCVGMFAIALWDADDRRLHLIRDRMGEKPLYYGWSGDALVFGSELKALSAHPLWDGVVDRDALTLLFRHSYIPAPYSIYRGVWKLKPGMWLTVSREDVRRHRLAEPVPYWSLIEAAQHGAGNPFMLDDQAALSELDRLCTEAISTQRLADVPLGAFLSGGVDSSAIVALMQTQSTRPVRTFSIGFAEDGFDEAKHASRVARHLCTEHSDLYVTAAQARAIIPQLPVIYDEPFSDSSQIPTYIVAQMAKQHVTVALSGDAGDELFRRLQPLFTLPTTSSQSNVDAAAYTSRLGGGCGRKSALAFERSPTPS